MKRVVLALVLAAAGMTIASLLTRHALPSLTETAAFLLVALVTIVVLNLARAGWRRAGR